MTPQELTSQRIDRLQKQGLKLKPRTGSKNILMTSIPHNMKARKRAIDTMENFHKFSFKIKRFLRKLFK